MNLFTRRPFAKSAPQPSPELEQEWRTIDWSKRNDIRKELIHFKLQNPRINHLRMLLLGQVGCGKSSFINSACSVFEDRVIYKADAAYGSTTSKTKQYKAFKIMKDEKTLPFIFNDIMGLESDEGTTRGIQLDDILNALKGHVEENYVFNSASPIKEDNSKYNASPGLNDKIHCVVSIMPAPTISLMDMNIIKKMKKVGEKASELGVSVVVILTKIDECCPLVKKDLKKVYKSKKIKQKMEECSDMLGVPMTCIFPVKNYHEEAEPNPEMDVLILSALKRVVNIANDFGENLCDKCVGNTKVDKPSSSKPTPPATLPKPILKPPVYLNQSFSFKQPTNTIPSINPIPLSVSEFNKSWRNTNWSKRVELEDTLRNFELSNSNITQLRILLNGPAGAGKSSTINSIHSTFAQRIVTKALVSYNQNSQTKQYKSHTIKYGNLKLIFNNMMGLEASDSTGIHPDDIKNALQGHIKENYVFNPIRPIRAGDPGYHCSPTPNDKVHCLVSIMSGPSIPHIPNTVIRNMRAVRETANYLGIPQVVIMTKIDQCCPLVQADLKKVYFSKKIKEMMIFCHDQLGIPMNCIFPVKNYHEEMETDNDMDVLILSAVKQIVNFANDYVED